MKINDYDVIVVGGGHAGCEAALASSRMGTRTLLITMCIDTIGLMSCNPAIGGIGKGQLVKEIDALGGEMGKAADACGIQFRILNASRGAAVWSSRAQVDSAKYNLYMKNVCSNQKRLDIIEDEVTDLYIIDNTITGVKTGKNGTIGSNAVVITPGTFLNGLIHIGMKSFKGGRIEDAGSSESLSQSLQNIGFKLLRFKTGTCARLDGKTIDFSKLRVQNGDNPIRPFSFSSQAINHANRVPCHITHTNEKTHEIIRSNLHLSPLFNGKITGRGVRYCPSLEDKVVKFPHHSRHQVFLEPEGLDTDVFYPNGISTSLPEQIQDQFIHTIAGLEEAKITRYGYGIEHDVVDPVQLYQSLETKLISNLYFAGQINGTTGYEEAAAQGLVAGINASLRVNTKEPMILARSTSYIGVLLDDLVTKGTNEPYRMFTSRVEYRLLLREDNADMRLRKIGYDLGLVKKEDYQQTLDKKSSMRLFIEHLKNTRFNISLSLSKKTQDVGCPSISKPSTLYELLKRPGFNIENIKTLGLLSNALPYELEKAVESEVKYSGYIKKQLIDIRRFKNLEKVKMPSSLDFNAISGLSNEIREKLNTFKPSTLGQASRISGITPVAISILMIHLKK